MKIDANLNSVLFIPLPDCKSGATVEGGLTRVAAISLPGGDGPLELFWEME